MNEEIMKKNNSTKSKASDDEHLTASESIRRLKVEMGHAPRRQSFYDAARKGKIQEIKNENPVGGKKRHYSWNSIQCYVAGGGFRLRRKSSKYTAASADTKSLGHSKADAPEVPVESRKKSEARNRSVKKPKKRDERAGVDKEETRQRPSLRVTKNSLRHLDFESAKDVRDWLDNRLLFVLTKTVSSRVDSTNSEAEAK